MSFGAPAGSGVGLLPRLHAVTDGGVVGRTGFFERAREVLAVGGERVAIHLRAREMAARDLFVLAESLAREAARAGGALFVNDRLDVALAAGAHGVHLGGRSIAPLDARRAVEAMRAGARSRGAGAAPPPAASGPPANLPPPLALRWIGLSVHAPPEVLPGADYLFVGTLFATESHPAHPGAGPARIGGIRGVSELPLVGIGGITPQRVRAVIEAGAYGVAAIRGVWDAPAPGAAALSYLQAIEASTGR